MTPTQFCFRLVTVANDRWLTDSDLAVWFQRPRPTIRTWVERHYSPRPGSMFNELVRRLELLEASEAFPVPYGIKRDGRRPYIEQAFANANSTRVPASDPAR